MLENYYSEVQKDYIWEHNILYDAMKNPVLDLD